ncbi:hypothetical protein, partial [Rhizobium leguminosarum]|uniref:hypothetical protein n=1 Tax=Rhizobium leguminosarum TaxID=384 RepID=UPI003F945AAB
IIFSLLIGTLFFIFFLKIFPQGWSKQNAIAKILVPFVFPMLAFFLLRGIMLLINSKIGQQRDLFLVGVILEKEIEKSSNGTRFYYLK